MRLLADFPSRASVGSIGNLSFQRNLFVVVEIAMFWTIVILGVVAGSLALGYRAHKQESKNLTELFIPIAETFDGTIKEANFLALPRLEFEHLGNHYVASAISGGESVSGTASRPGSNGSQFTYVKLDLPFDSKIELNVLRTCRLDRAIRKATTAFGMGQIAPTGNELFDSQFQVTTSNSEWVPAIIDEAIQDQFLKSKQIKLEVRINGRKVSVHIDGCVKSLDDLTEMIDLARTLADKCKLVAKCPVAVA